MAIRSDEAQGGTGKGSVTDADGRTVTVPGPHQAAKGKTHDGVSIATTASSNADLTTTGYSKLTVLGRLTGGDATDIDVTVRPYENNGTTLYEAKMTPAKTHGPEVVSSVAYIGREYDLSGIDKVQVRLTNNDLLTQTGTGVYYLQS